MRQYEAPVMQVEAMFADTELAGAGSRVVTSMGEGYVYDDDE